LRFTRGTRFWPIPIFFNDLGDMNDTGDSTGDVNQHKRANKHAHTIFRSGFDIPLWGSFWCLNASNNGGTHKTFLGSKFSGVGSLWYAFCGLPIWCSHLGWFIKRTCKFKHTRLCTPDT
jgi:hypothetical protein